MNDIQYWWLIVLPVFFGLGWLAARIDIKHVLSEAKSLPAAYFQGLNFLLNGETNRAVDIYVDIARNHVETIELQFTLGTLFRRRGELERAIRMHQKLLGRRELSDSQRQSAQLELAIDFMKAGLFDRAEDLLHALANTEYARQAREELLAIYQQEHEWRQAIDVAAQLRDENHTYQYEIAQFNCELAASALTRGNFAEAHQYLERALTEHRQCARARLMLGELAMAQGDAETAIESWLEIEKYDVNYLALAARPLLAAYEKLGKADEGDQLLVRMSRQNPELDVVDLVYERLSVRQGTAAAYEFVRERLRDNPSMPGLKKVLEAHLLVAPDAQKPELEIITRLLNENTREHSMYYCRECGFKTRQYFWHCPACNEWETYPPVRGKKQHRSA